MNTFPGAGVHTLLKRPAKVSTQCSYGAHTVLIRVRVRGPRLTLNWVFEKESNTTFQQLLDVSDTSTAYLLDQSNTFDQLSNTV